MAHHSSSSMMKHCSHAKAPRASPRKASSRSKVLRVRSSDSPSRTAWRYISRMGRIKACVMSRWRSQVASSAAEAGWWMGQNLGRGLRKREGSGDGRGGV